MVIFKLKQGRFIMKTEAIVFRPLFGGELRQSSKDGFFCATDLVNIANRERALELKSTFYLNKYFLTEQTKEFMQEMESQFGTVKRSSKGRNGAVWVHPLLFLDIALSISPKAKIKVYQWVYDELIKYRNDSGDSYKRMCGHLFENSTNKQGFQKEIAEYANLIKRAVGVNDWNHARTDQLEQRDKIHDAVVLSSSILRRNADAVNAAIVHVCGKDIFLRLG